MARKDADEVGYNATMRVCALNLHYACAWRGMYVELRVAGGFFG